MQLAQLSGLWLLGLLIPLVTLYLLKFRRKRTVVSSTRLWQAALREQKARHPFRRLVPELSLILQALMLVMLAFAAAKPLGLGQPSDTQHLVVVIDVSASMGATNNKGTRHIVLAREQARALIDSLPGDAEVMLITAGRSASVQSPFERDRRRLREHLERIDALEVEGKLVSAVSLGADRLRQIPSKRELVVITDGALADRSPILTQGVPVRVITVGDSQDNVGIIRIDVRHDVQAPASAEAFTVHVFALVKNFGKQTKNLFAVLRQRNVTEPLASRQIQLQPDEEAPVVLSFDAVAADQGTGLIVELSPSDHMPADDRAFALVPITDQQTVVLSPPDKTPWLKRALLADPHVRLLGISEKELAQTEPPRGSLLVFAGYCPTQVPASNFVIINPPRGPCLAHVVEQDLQFPQITNWNQTDSRLRFLSLAEVRIASARRIEPESPGQILITSQHGPLMTKFDTQGRQGTLIGFSFGESDWPLKASFVLFVRNLVELSRAERHQKVRGSFTTGEPLRLPVPIAVHEVALETDEGDKRELVAQDGVALVPDLPKAGFYFFSWAGPTPGSSLLPANLTSARESDLSSNVVPKVFTTDGSEQQRKVESSNYRWWLAALALALLLADVWLLTRRRVRFRAKRAKP